MNISDDWVLLWERITEEILCQLSNFERLVLLLYEDRIKEAAFFLPEEARSGKLLVFKLPEFSWEYVDLQGLPSQGFLSIVNPKRILENIL